MASRLGRWPSLAPEKHNLQADTSYSQSGTALERDRAGGAEGLTWRRWTGTRWFPRRWTEPRRSAWWRRTFPAASLRRSERQNDGQTQFRVQAWQRLRRELFSTLSSENVSAWWITPRQKQASWSLIVLQCGRKMSHFEGLFSEFFLSDLFRHPSELRSYCLIYLTYVELSKTVLKQKYFYFEKLRSLLSCSGSFSLFSYV